MDYNKTLNLPQTGFPMRASLPQREPALLPHMSGVYQKLMEQNAGKPSFLLHDGPPFSNGDIHMGHALNKLLKDFVVRSKNMMGYYAPYVPGWDNHGMPIETAIIKKQKLDRKSMPTPEFRDACRDFAADFVERQKEQFIRLGVLGDWEHPYLTMDPSFEAAEIRVFGEMYQKGLIYKGLKPVYWCTHDRTALAEAEIEYRDDPCTSIYVKFPIKDDKGKLSAYGDPSKVFFVIWTTTTWTLPGNVALCVHPDFVYGVVRAGGEVFIVAEALRENVAAAAGWESYETLGSITGRELEYMTARHPFLERDSLVICGGHVTAETGTGIVHTAPGHGAEDYQVGIGYKLPMPVPVDGAGMMTGEAGAVCAGMRYDKANGAILSHLRETGHLLASAEITHTYPHCWRCDTPILFRATEQWFASIDSIKDAACAEIERVRWIPGWGQERMLAMVRERSDWCISRQRNWGLPIPVFYCGDCAKPVCTPESIEAVASCFENEGSNAWFVKDAAALLPAGFVCPHCGGTSFTKETDTLDGWFDSGATHDAVLKPRAELRWPSDLYLEGNDQFRGWFQSSLLTAVATGTGKAPYGEIVVHGMITDPDGKKMSKSKGNGLDPAEICNQNGADILRLWVSSSDFRTDMRVSADMLKQLGEIYLKIRNTCRFLLGNLFDYNPDDSRAAESLSDLDLWALDRLDALIGKVKAAYESYEFHTIFHAVHNFCVLDMSNFYLDIVKDALYCESPGSPARRAIQYVLHKVLDALARLVAPVLAFTSEELWAAMRHGTGVSPESPLLAGMPEPTGLGQRSDWIETLFAIRPLVSKALEDKRTEKLIGKSLEAQVGLLLPHDDYVKLAPYKDKLAQIFIVSKLVLEENGQNTDASVTIMRAPGEKCERCWGYFENLGENPHHPTMCPRCADVVSGS